jgi:hypothetical protein
MRGILRGELPFFCPIFTGGQTHILLRDSSLAIPGFYCSQGCNSGVLGSGSGRSRYSTLPVLPSTLYTGKLEYTWLFIRKLGTHPPGMGDGWLRNFVSCLQNSLLLYNCFQLRPSFKVTISVSAKVVLENFPLCFC